MKQAVEVTDERVRKENIWKQKFSGAKYLCQMIDLAHSRTGDVIIKFRIPYVYRHQAAELIDAYGMMLECDIQPWSQAEEAKRGRSDPATGDRREPTESGGAGDTDS